MSYTPEQKEHTLQDLHNKIQEIYKQHMNKKNVHAGVGSLASNWI